MKPRELLAKGYVGALGHTKTQPVNHALYHLALRGMGYNNGWELADSGEEWFIRHVLAPSHPRLCVDVGANKGDYTELLLRRTATRVLAFEPLPLAFQGLEWVVNLWPSRVTAIESAVGATNEPALIHFGDGDSELASLSEEVNSIYLIGISNTNTLEVAVTTLDDYFAAHLPHGRIDLIKIDTEGFEYEVLQGAQNLIANRPPRFIQIEMNIHQMIRGHTLYRLWELVGGAYEVYQLMPHGMHQVDVMKPEANTFCYSNFIFVLKGDRNEY